MKRTEFIRANLWVDVLTADRVEDILPKLRVEAANACGCQTDGRPGRQRALTTNRLAPARAPDIRRGADFTSL
jgi:hypothetical protein